MATFSNNGVNIYYEDTGEGYPLVWSHEFAGNYDSWEPQARFFTRRYRVITYAARGYPPSDVPEDPDAYSQELAVDDLRQLLGHLGIEQAHLGGLSMGGAVVLNFGFAYPEMCRSLVVASAGSGTTDREAFLANSEAMAARLLADGMGSVADEYTRGPARVQLLRKDPRGWQEFRDGMAAHSAMGSALTFRGFQIKRPTIYQLEEQPKGAESPDASNDRGRRRTLRRAEHIHETAHPKRGVIGISPERPRHQPRGAGPVQPNGLGLPDRGGGGTVGLAGQRDGPNVERELR